MSLREELLTQGCTEKLSNNPNKLKRVVYFENQTGEVVAKVCTKCGELKKAEEFFKDKTKLGGRKPSCRECDKERDRKYYEENRDKTLDYARKYREENRDKILDCARKYREENREKIRKYYEENREKEIERVRKYYEENRDKVLEGQRKYYEENRDKYRLKDQRRRARKNALPDDFTFEQQNEVLSHFNNCCALTGEQANRTWDHAIPIASGHGGTTYGNMYPLRGDLNSSKNDSNLFEWFESNRQRFKLSQERFDTLVKYLADINGMTVEEYTEYYYGCFDEISEIADAI